MRDRLDADDGRVHAVRDERLHHRLSQRREAGWRRQIAPDAHEIAGLEAQQAAARDTDQPVRTVERRGLIQVQPQHEQPVGERMRPRAQPAVRDAAREQRVTHAVASSRSTAASADITPSSWNP